MQLCYELSGIDEDSVISAYFYIIRGQYYRSDNVKVDKAVLDGVYSTERAKTKIWFLRKIKHISCVNTINVQIMLKQYYYLTSVVKIMLMSQIEMSAICNKIYESVTT